MKVNEDIQVTQAVTGQLRAWLFDVIRGHARAINRRAVISASDRVEHGIDADDDFIVDDSGKGLVLKSPNGHYWRVSVSNAGSLSTADLGTAKP